MENSGKSPKPLRIVKLKAIEAYPSNFKEFGQVIESSPDGHEFGAQDAQLDLSRGIPRFYIMQLKARELKFSKLTHHASVTQCLGSIGGQEWYLGVAKPSIVETNGMNEINSIKANTSKCGHHYIPPYPNDVHVFRVVGPKFLKLNIGTWHAGPLFKTEAMDFYNLELSDTNVVDHTTHDFTDDGVIFHIEG